MATDSENSPNIRLETTDDFRRRKRNLLTVSWLGTGFALAKTGSAISLPGFSETSISASLVELALLSYLIYTYLEYWHEVEYIKGKNSEWAIGFDRDGDILYSVKYLKRTIDDASRNIETTISIFDESSEVEIPALQGKMESLQESVSPFRQIDVSENAPASQLELEKSWNEIHAASEEVLIDAQAYNLQIEGIVSKRSSHHIDISRRLFSNIEDLKNLVDRELIPSASAMTSISRKIYNIDGRMFRWHDINVPKFFFFIALASLTFDATEKIYSFGLSAFHSTEITKGEAKATAAVK